MQEQANPLLRGEEGALKRALYKSMGYDDEALARPLVAVVNTFTTATPGHFTLDELSRQVQLGIESAGGTAMSFGQPRPDRLLRGVHGARAPL